MNSSEPPRRLCDQSARHQCSARQPRWLPIVLGHQLRLAPPTIGRPPCAVAHACDAPPETAHLSFDAASCCRTNKRQRYSRRYSPHPPNEGGDARPCIGEFLVVCSICKSPEGGDRGVRPTWAGRNSSSAPPVRASLSGVGSSVLSWHEYSIRLHEKRMRGAQDGRSPAGSFCSREARDFVASQSG